MVKRTYGDLKSRLGRVAGVNGFRSTDERLKERVNDAIEDIMESDDFPFVIDFYSFTVSNGSFILPNHIDRIVGANIDGKAAHYRSPWYEYIDTAYVDLNDLPDRDLIILERNETPIQIPFPSEFDGYRLKVTTIADESAGALHVRGLDENGATVYSGTNTEGLDIALPDTGDIITTQKFSKIEAVIKPNTNKPIKVYARDDSDNDTLIAEYTPKDTTPSYRQYFIPALETEDTHTVNIRGKRRFIPIDNDNDTLAISNYQAIKYMLISHHKGETQDEVGAQTNYTLAREKMWQSSRSYRGKTKTPAVVSELGTGTGDFNTII